MSAIWLAGVSDSERATALVSTHDTALCFRRQDERRQGRAVWKVDSQKHNLYLFFTFIMYNLFFIYKLLENHEDRRVDKEKKEKKSGYVFC